MNKQAYEQFLESKRRVIHATGIAKEVELHPSLFAFQAAVTRWALRRGRAALWLDTGLGNVTRRPLPAFRIGLAIGFAAAAVAALLLELCR